MPHSGPDTRGKSRNRIDRERNRLREHLDGSRERRSPAAAHAAERRRPREHLQRAAQKDDGGNRRRRGEQRLAVEERRDDQEAGEADDQRAVAEAARFEILDADQREQERDARIASDEIAEVLANGDRGDDREQAQHPRPDDRRAACRDVSPTARSARSASRRATVPRQAIHSGTYAIIGSWVAEHQRAEPAHLADRQRVVARRHRRAALLLEEEVGRSHRGDRRRFARRHARSVPA